MTDLRASSHLVKNRAFRAHFTAVSSEARALYNMAVSVSRESNAYHMMRWATDKLAQNPEDEALKATLAKYQRIHQTYAFARSDEYGAEIGQLARERWLTGLAGLEALLKLLVAARQRDDLTTTKVPAKVLQNSVARRLQRAWQAVRRSPLATEPQYTRGQLITLSCNPQTVSKTALREGRIKLCGKDSGVKLGSFIDPKHVQSAEIVFHQGTVSLRVLRRVPPTGEAPRWLKERCGPMKRQRHGSEPLWASVDFGGKKLITAAFSHTYLTPITYDGAHLRQVNQWAHKRNSQIRSTYDRQGLRRGPALECLWAKHDRQVKHEIDSIAADFVARMFYLGVERIVIGWNPGFKTGLNMGRRWNQIFGALPLARLRDRILAYAAEVGLETQVLEEAYTSRASFLDDDFVPAFSEEKRGTYTFSGRRRKRGFYQAGDGRFIHADVNAALNLLRKSNCRFTYVNAAGRGTVVVPWGVPALWRPRGRQSEYRPLERVS